MAATLDPATERVLFSDAHIKTAAPLPLFFRATSAAALELLFPPHCITCGVPLGAIGNKALCRVCAARLDWIGSDRCRRCGDAVGRGSGVVDDCPACRTHPPAHVKASCAVVKFGEGPARELIHLLKFASRTHLVPLFAELLAQRIQVTQLFSPGMIVIPVPITCATLRKRAFNQAEEIAACVARRLKLPLDTRVLNKIRSTPPQAMLPLEQRRKNLAGAFSCDEKRVARCKNATVLLIDDVMTTGSTFSECARTLVHAGLGEVRAAAFARA